MSSKWAFLAHFGDISYISQYLPNFVCQVVVLHSIVVGLYECEHLMKLGSIISKVHVPLLTDLLYERKWRDKFDKPLEIYLFFKQTEAGSRQGFYQVSVLFSLSFSPVVHFFNFISSNSLYISWWSKSLAMSTGVRSPIFTVVLALAFNNSSATCLWPKSETKICTIQRCTTILLSMFVTLYSIGGSKSYITVFSL